MTLVLVPGRTRNVLFKLYTFCFPYTFRSSSTCNPLNINTPQGRPNLTSSAESSESLKEVDHIVKQVEELLVYLQRRMEELK